MSSLGRVLALCFDLWSWPFASVLVLVLVCLFCWYSRIFVLLPGLVLSLAKRRVTLTCSFVVVVVVVVSEQRTLFPLNLLTSTSPFRVRT